MEILLEDYLIKLHSLNFADSKQITDNIERYLLDESLNLSQICY